MIDLSKQTKYFRNIYNKEKYKFELESIPLNKNNWGYVQLDGIIRTIFLKYNFPIPKYVVLDELKHNTIINIFRGTIKNEKELLRWKENYVCIMDELHNQAECNSTYMEDRDDWIKYEFKLM